MKRAYIHRDEIQRLNVDADYLRIYQLTTLYDFAGDSRVGQNLAFYRIFAIPHMAELLVRTGEMLGHPTKRAYDTGLVMYEIITNGFDHPRSREMIRLMNRVHKPWPISDEDFRYVLAAFIVVPLRWIDRRGWRPLLDAEREAATSFYRELGRRMNIPDPPQSYQEAADLLDSYEQRHMAPSTAGRHLMVKTQDIVVRKIPSPLKRFGPTLTSALVDDADLNHALGLDTARGALRSVIRLGYVARNQLHKIKEPSPSPWFVPGRPVSTLYPQGYAITDLGPSGMPVSQLASTD